ncbi:MAG TPA: hypothetical protein PLG34_13710, partial [Spirochaetota bacterium]|nr:hypothetical protein [Spirochaetota bacterium]
DRDYTAEEVAEELFLRGKVKVLERNTSAPRLTYMEQAGILEVVGKRKSTMSGKNVAVYRLKDELV